MFKDLAEMAVTAALWLVFSVIAIFLGVGAIIIGAKGMCLIVVLWLNVTGTSVVWERCL